jgi:hypothetical protein
MFKYRPSSCVPVPDRIHHLSLIDLGLKLNLLMHEIFLFNKYGTKKKLLYLVKYHFIPTHTRRVSRLLDAQKFMLIITFSLLTFMHY